MNKYRQETIKKRGRMEGSVNDFTRRKTVHIQGFHFFVALPFNFTLSRPQLPFKFYFFEQL